MIATPRSATSVATTILICVLAVLYPIHTEAFANMNLSAGDVVVAVLLLGVALGFVRGPVPLPRYMPHIVTLAVVIVASVVVNALTWTTYYSLYDGFIEAVKFLAVVAWMVAIFALVRPQLRRRFIEFAVASAVVATVWSVRTVFENVILGTQRPDGPFDNANLYGNYIVFNACLALGAAKVLAESDEQATGGLAWLRKRRSLLTIVVLPALVLGLLSTGSRGAMISFAVAMLAAVRLWLPKRVTFRLVVTAVLGFAILGAGVDWFLRQNPYVLKRVERTGRGEQNVEERLDLWKAAGAAFVERPLLGIGYGEFSRYAKHRHHLKPKVTHQTYLSVAAELGIAGFITFMWLLLTALWDSWRVRTPIRGAIASCCCAFLVATSVHGFFSNIEQMRTFWMTFGIIAAVLSVREPGASVVRFVPQRSGARLRSV
jgi:O-antigen ligase